MDTDTAVHLSGKATNRVQTRSWTLRCFSLSEGIESARHTHMDQRIRASLAISLRAADALESQMLIEPDRLGILFVYIRRQIRLNPQRVLDELAPTPDPRCSGSINSASIRIPSKIMKLIGRSLSSTASQRGACGKRETTSASISRLSAGDKKWCVASTARGKYPELALHPLLSLSESSL